MTLTVRTTPGDLESAAQFVYLLLIDPALEPVALARWKEVRGMEAIKIPDSSERLDWRYDKETDVLYVGVGKPRKSIGVDIGEGVVVRYDDVPLGASVSLFMFPILAVSAFFILRGIRQRASA